VKIHIAIFCDKTERDGWQSVAIISKAHTASFFRIDVYNLNYHIFQNTAAWYVKLCHSTSFFRRLEEPESLSEPFGSGPNSVNCTALVEAQTD
jgi:hypothetical protein